MTMKFGWLSFFFKTYLSLMGYAQRLHFVINNIEINMLPKSIISQFTRTWHKVLTISAGLQRSSQWQ